MYIDSNPLTNPGDLIHDQQMQLIFQQVKDTMKDIDLKDGDFLYFSDEHHRVKISPYRMTMEIRFPNGINHIPE